jgi:hypothetical protein
MDRLGLHTLGLHPTFATSTPRTPSTAQALFRPAPSAQSDHQGLTLLPEEHTGGCRPSFPLDAFPPPEARLRRCSPRLRWQALHDITYRLP